MSRRHKKHHEEHDEHPSEAWLIALADMMTLLMVTFLMMFAISIMDLKKFQTFKEAFAEGTGTSVPALPGDGVPIDGDQYTEPVAPADGAPSEERSKATSDPKKVLNEAELKKLQELLTAQLSKAGIADKVEARITSRGLVLYVTDAVLFDTGAADVTRNGEALLDGLGVVLADIGNDLVVEGHTDKRPIRTAQFPSNWELSANRAAAVARRLMDADNVDARRVSIAGYGDTRPRRDANSPEAFAANRRVEIVVEAPPPPAPAPPVAAEPAAAKPAAPVTGSGSGGH